MGDVCGACGMHSDGGCMVCGMYLGMWVIVLALVVHHVCVVWSTKLFQKTFFRNLITTRADRYVGKTFAFMGVAFFTLFIIKSWQQMNFTFQFSNSATWTFQLFEISKSTTWRFKYSNKKLAAGFLEK